MEFQNDCLARAHHLLASALQLLDEAEASADIGACVDHAMVRLSEVIEERRIQQPKGEVAKFWRRSDATS